MTKITDWKSEIQEITTAFQAGFGACSPTELNWKPNAKTWSIAQNIDHLITVNRTYFPVVKAIREGVYTRPFLARFQFVNRFFGNLILQSVSPKQQRKTRTFPLWEPSQSELDSDILDRFVAHQEELIHFFQSCEDLLQQNVVISSPANKYITYTLERAFDIIVAHEKRHLKQAKELIALKQTTPA